VNDIVNVERERESQPGRDISYCLDANYAKGTNTTLKSRRQLVMEHTIAYSKSHRDNGVVQARGKIDDEANTLSTGDGCTSQSTGNYVFTTEGEVRIRRITPLEAERLQGYPDNWTKYGRRADGTLYELSDTQRYKLCGNGVSSPVPKSLFPAIFGTENIDILDLFSGCHGTGLLLPPNFKTVGFSEVDKYANDALRYHYPEIPNFGDVTRLVDLELPKFDLLTFGYPCQDVSSAGKNLGEDGARTSLVWSVCDLIEKTKPAYICAENVKNHLSNKHEKFFTKVLERLSSIGYELDFEVVNSKDFGLAQNRQRVFIFGKLK